MANPFKIISRGKSKEERLRIAYERLRRDKKADRVQRLLLLAELAEDMKAVVAIRLYDHLDRITAKAGRPRGTATSLIDDEAALKHARSLPPRTKGRARIAARLHHPRAEGEDLERIVRRLTRKLKSGATISSAVLVGNSQPLSGCLCLSRSSPTFQARDR